MSREIGTEGASMSGFSREIVYAELVVPPLEPERWEKVLDTIKEIWRLPKVKDRRFGGNHIISHREEIEPVLLDDLDDFLNDLQDLGVDVKWI